MSRQEQGRGRGPWRGSARLGQACVHRALWASKTQTFNRWEAAAGDSLGNGERTPKGQACRPLSPSPRSFPPPEPRENWGAAGAAPLRSAGHICLSRSCCPTAAAAQQGRGQAGLHTAAGRRGIRAARCLPDRNKIATSARGPAGRAGHSPELPTSSGKDEHEGRELSRFLFLQQEPSRGGGGARGDAWVWAGTPQSSGPLQPGAP